MNKESYKNREIDEKFTNFKGTMEEGFKDILEKMSFHNTNTLFRLDAIDTKLGTQNGRVRKLENWKIWTIGATGGFVPVLIASGSWLFYQVTETIPDKAEASAQRAVGERMPNKSIAP